MDKLFYMNNRKRLYDALEDNSLCLVLAGDNIRQSADSNYEFFPNRNFIYLTGLRKDSQKFVLLAQKKKNIIKETLFILYPNKLEERWTGKRLTTEEISNTSAINNFEEISNFNDIFFSLCNSGEFNSIYLNLERTSIDDPDDINFVLAKNLLNKYPYISIHSSMPILRKLRTIKDPQEIQAMREAIRITGEGICAMMKITSPGIFAYNLKAEFDACLAHRAVLNPAFASIISSGVNNFYIHNTRYDSKLHEGDLVLSDVGASIEGICCDISRAWPVNRTFTSQQKLLYECAYQTSEYMFSIVKPGMKMKDVDLTIKTHCGNLLLQKGILASLDNVGNLMWHGGAHHVGFDVHDVIETPEYISPGMVFCIDIGIYNTDLGIGFRLEDNCYITKNGCENLSRNIPRSIYEIEKCMSVNSD